jgi:hypothetical protein
MNDEPRDQPDSPAVQPAESAGAPPAAAPVESTPANQLTPEEQMARFEQALKETDWGHQPC